jgi:hypothetical protein
VELVAWLALVVALASLTWQAVDSRRRHPVRIDRGRLRPRVLAHEVALQRRTVKCSLRP